MIDDYELSYHECPKCQVNLHTRRCSEITCENGMIDESDEDYLLEGTSMVTCSTCSGAGHEHWCPNCGTDYSGILFNSDEEE